MSLMDTLAQLGKKVAPFAAVATLVSSSAKKVNQVENQTQVVNSVQQEQAPRMDVAELEQMVKEGPYVNGLSRQERREKLQAIAQQKGLKEMMKAASVDARDIQWVQKENDLYRIHDGKNDTDTYYYPDGQMASSVDWKTGKAVGYYSNSNQKEFECAGDDKPYYRYHPNGQLRATPYVGFYQDHNYQVFDESGRVSAEHRLLKSEWRGKTGGQTLHRTEQWTLFDPATGKKTASYQLDTDKLTQVTLCDQNGHETAYNIAVPEHVRFNPTEEPATLHDLQKIVTMDQKLMSSRMKRAIIYDENQ